MDISNVKDNMDLWRTVVLQLNRSLLGRVSAAVRGVTLDFDGQTIVITVFFMGSPSERDEENMRDAEAEVVSSHDYQSELRLRETTGQQLVDEMGGNWGWVFLRDEGR